MKNILFIGILTILLLSCEKSNIGDHQDYIGFWSNTTGNVTCNFEVRFNGQCNFDKITCSGNTNKTESIDGKFILDGSNLKIGKKHDY